MKTDNFRRSGAMALIPAIAFFAIACACIVPHSHAADIKLLSGSALEPVFPEIIRRFEQSTGHKIILDSNGAIGAMTARIEQGEIADVVIVSGEQIARLEKQGRVVNGSRRDLARVGIGLFVRKGAAKPDLSSVESFRVAMMSAKSIGYNDPAAGAPVSLYLLELFEHMGIGPEMKAKSVAFKIRTERFAPVARGEVEIGFNQISEILAAEGVELAGPLPEKIQNFTQFSAGIVANGRQPEAARALVEFMSSPQSKAIMKEKGFE